MDPARWKRIEQVYHAVLIRAPRERKAFLDHACAGDEDLRREVETLLAQPSGDELEAPALPPAGDLLSDAGPGLIGRRLGAYQIQAQIGAGGMGEVYRARDIRLGRDVALKVLPALFASDPGRLARFEREARLLAALNHPRIATIHGLEDLGRFRALVLELVDGPTLAERIARGPLNVDEALALARQIADALEAAHDKGIIHRDLKPANIKVLPNGDVKVLDFGLAKALSGDESGPDISHLPTVTATQLTGFIVGTPAYMSPEQARGHHVDTQTDIWAFGCVLYEMLAGRAAFARDTVTDTLAAVVDARPDWSCLPSIPPAIMRLLQRCLEKDVRRRLHDIADARIELDDARSGEPASVVPRIESPTRKPTRWSALIAGAITSAGIGAVIAVIALTTLTPVSPSGGAPSRIVASQLTNHGGTEQAGAISPDGRSFAFVSNHAGTPDLYLRQVSGGEPVRLTNDAAEEQLPAFAPDGDTVYFTRIDEAGTAIWRTRALGGPPRKVLDNAQTPAPAPDGKRLAYVTRGTVGFNLGVMALDGSGARTLVEHIRTGTFRPAWSPDGRWLTYSNWPLFGPTDVFVVDAATGTQRQVARLPPPAAANDGGRPVWLPDNRHLVISYSPLARQQAPADLGILDTRDGSIVRLTMTVGDGLYTPSISADGSRLIATRLHYAQEILKVPLTSDPDTNGRAAVRLIGESAGPQWTFVSRDGRTVLFNSPASGSRNLWTTSTGQGTSAVQITTVAGDAVSHSSLSPDGTHVAFASIASGHSDIWTQRVDGSQLRQLTTDEHADSWPVWSPDGEWIAYLSYRADRQETWRIKAAGGSPEKLFDHGFRGDWIRQPTGNGTWIVTTGSTTGSGVRLIDVERRAVVWEQTIPGGNLSLPVFAPDGRSISAPFREDRVHDVIRVFDVSTGHSRIAARLPFHVTFRAGWTDDGRAVVVNRNDEVSHIVMFDNFWSEGRDQ